MVYTILEGETLAASTTYQGQLRGCDIDHIGIQIRQADHSDSMTFAESQTCTVDISVRRTTEDGGREDIMICESARVEDLAKYTNSNHGIGQLPGTNNPTKIHCWIPTGRLVLKGSDELILTIKTGAIGTINSGSVYAYAYNLDDEDSPIMRYISFNAQDNISFNDVVELYSAGVSGAGAAGNTYHLNFGDGQKAIPDYSGEIVELALGQYENGEDVVSWFLLFQDPDGTGKDLQVRVPAANTELFAVCRHD